MTRRFVGIVRLITAAVRDREEFWELSSGNLNGGGMMPSKPDFRDVSESCFQEIS
jgi:hypothetical protein